MSISESCITNDIVKVLKDEFDLVYPTSTERRIRRFFNNKLFKNYKFYEDCIKNIISRYKLSQSDNRVHIVMDHMFMKDSFTVFMISMRIGKQSIPLWFRCFEGTSDPNAFKQSTLEEGITFVSDLFKDKNYKLIFLGDRWFNSTKLMNFIDSLGHTYVFRLKENFKCFVYDKRKDIKYGKMLTNYFTINITLLIMKILDLLKKKLKLI